MGWLALLTAWEDYWDCFVKILLLKDSIKSSDNSGFILYQNRPISVLIFSDDFEYCLGDQPLNGFYTLNHWNCYWLGDIVN